MKIVIEDGKVTIEIEEQHYPLMPSIGNPIGVGSFPGLQQTWVYTGETTGKVSS